MNPSVFEFYQNEGRESEKRFFETVLLDEESYLSWKEVSKMAPSLPRGWFELSRLSLEDRLDFSCDFWQKTLPYLPHFSNFLTGFFGRLEDIAVFLTKKTRNSSYEAELVYSMKNENCFFRGRPPIASGEIELLGQHFHDRLPRDYLSFFKIHNGFCRNDENGLLSSRQVIEYTDKMQSFLLDEEKIIKSSKGEVDVSNLIFFYQDTNHNAFQCFYYDWYPNGGIGNVYLSLNELAISDYGNLASSKERLSFPAFLDWLIFYLEEI